MPTRRLPQRFEHLVNVAAPLSRLVGVGHEPLEPCRLSSGGAANRSPLSGQTAAIYPDLYPVIYSGVLYITGCYKMS